MRLVEHHRIDRHDPRYAAIDAAAFASKNLYNATSYAVRQAYILRAERIRYPASRPISGAARPRGLFRTARGGLLNADVNAACNILVKAAPEAFPLGRRGCVVQPVWLELPNRTSRGTNPALVS